MKVTKSKFRRKRHKLRRQLSRSILLDETGSTLVIKLTLLFLLLLVSFFIAWSTFVPLNEVVSVPGDVQPIGQSAKVQHQRGGKITELNIQDQSSVTEGELLLKLDSSSLEMLIDEENSALYSLRVQRNLLLEELELQEKLYAQRLISATEYLALQRSITTIRGNIANGINRVKRYESEIEKLSLYAPISGTIHGLDDILPGAVIQTGQILFSIIPKDTQYYARIEIPANKIGSVIPGMTVTLKFSAYNYSRFGGMEAQLQDLSVTTYTDQKGIPYYQGIVPLPSTYLDEQKQYPILQGMTLIADIKTGDKTLFQYLFLPIKASRDTSFNEP